MEPLFHSSFGLQIGIPQVVREVLRFMAEEPGFRYRVTIGTDSQLLGTGDADFVTAIVVHRVGNGGRYFWRRIKTGKFHTLRDRIIREVLMSIEIAQKMLTRLHDEVPGDNWDFEIHADVGENGSTKAMIQEVTGMIRAHNFEVRTKPESYAASSVADRHA